MTIDSQFKLGRHTLLLLAFQFATGILIGIIFYLLSDLLKIVPASLDRPCGILCLLIGSMYFGQHMEKRNPGVLNKERIKKLTLVSTLINFVLSILFIFLTFIHYTTSESNASYKMLMIMMGFLVMTTLIMYATTSHAIKLGVKTRNRRQQAKLIQG